MDGGRTGRCAAAARWARTAHLALSGAAGDHHDAAYQYREEDSKGSIEVGKRADLVVLSADPTKVQPMTIKDIKVLETIKDGKTIYPAQ